MYLYITHLCLYIHLDHLDLDLNLDLDLDQDLSINIQPYVPIPTFMCVSILP